MADEPRPPKVYEGFLLRFPALGEAWARAREQEESGPLDGKVARLVKMGIAAGAMKQGAVRSAVRKARAAGASSDEVLQIIALAATTVGFPSAVALFSWIEDLVD